MGKELEIKLHVDSPAALEQILTDPQISALVKSFWGLTPMETAYFDTQDGALHARHWMLRRRLEGEASIVCFKTPPEGDGLTRGEWECASDDPQAAIPELIRLGAPQALRSLTAGQPLLPTCGARFVRRYAYLRFPDRSRCVLSGDSGELFRGEVKQEFCEIELELDRGSPEKMLAFADELMARHNLHVEPLSKFARAAAL